MANCENCIHKYVCKNYPVASLPPNIRKTIFKKLDEECKEFIGNAVREKGCEYCNNAAEIGSCDSDAKMRIEKGNMHCMPYIVVENDTFGTSDIFDADYCPQCGRKLGEENA